MINFLLSASNTPPWLGGPNILYAGIYGYGFASYEGRILEVYNSKGAYVTEGSSMGGQNANLGGGAFLRWNQLGISLDFSEAFYNSWTYKGTDYPDTSFYQRVGLDITWHINNESWTGIGLGFRTLRYASGLGFQLPDTSDSIAKIGRNVPLPNATVRFFSLGLQGKFFVEAEKIYADRRGLLPWVGGYVGYAQASLEAGEPLNATSDASGFHIEASLGLDFYVQPWLCFWISGRYSTFETNFPLSLPSSNKYKDIYDNVRTSSGITSVQGGIRLTFSRERY